MSERPTGNDPGSARARRPWPRFRDLPIWSKLGLIMIVPTLATIVVGTNGLIGHLETHDSADRARVLASLSQTTGELVDHLQQERATAVLLLGSQGDAQADAAGAYTEAQQPVDELERRFQSESATLTELPANFRELLGDIRSQLSLLPQTRNQITAGSFGLTDATASYERLIGNLINMRDSSAQFAGEIELGNRMRAATAIARAKELLSQQRVVGHEVLIRDAYHPHLRSAFIGARTGYEQALQAFAAVATSAEQARLDQALEGPDVRQSLLYQDYLDSLEGTVLVDPPWDAEAWDAVMAAHADLLRGLEAEFDSGITADATAMRDAVARQVLIESGALLLMLVLAIMLAWLVARSMARSLRDLRRGALEVAQYGLPQAVARLRDPSLSTHLSPTQVASQIAEPLPVRSRDEFGQVAEAFNAVHLEAVRTAAEQAQLRSSVSTMFVNLARRSQILVDRLINQLDRLERGEEDPDRLSELFQLDHLATRMRRNDENLLVLAGADSTRVRREPAALIDVLRAAQSEIEHYTRIEFGTVDRDLEISAHAVNDLVHLVAELLDNATAFSPPDSSVMVEARRVGDRAVLYVEDRGLGLSPEHLADINERLANPPLVDVAVSRMMGLVVVGRLATRHGVKVELRPAAGRGIIADVTLPTSVLSPRMSTGRPGAQPAVSDPGEQLALEGGPASFSQPPAGPVPSGARGFTQHPPPPFSPQSYPTDLPGAIPVSPPPAGLPAGATGPPASSGRPGASRGGRQMPAWSDLTGASSSANGTESAAPASPGGSLPRRRPGGSLNGVPGESPPAPAAVPEPRPEPAAVPRQQPDPAAETAPPPWPPVEPAASTPVPTEAGQAAGSTAARPEQPLPVDPPAPVVAAAAAAAASQAAQSAGVSETMELPIFREVESAWFRTRARPESQQAGAGIGSATVELAKVSPTTGGVGEASTPAGVAGRSSNQMSATAGAGMGGAMSSDPTRQMEGSIPAADNPAAREWRTAADEGWQAASTAADTPVQERTAAGLPKRRPMAQLVPGGVGKNPANAQHRSPEAVRGLLSAYHRGVQRGREQGLGSDREAAGPQSEAGKERRT